MPAHDLTNPLGTDGKATLLHSLQKQIHDSVIKRTPNRQGFSLRKNPQIGLDAPEAFDGGANGLNMDLRAGRMVCVLKGARVERSN